MKALAAVILITVLPNTVCPGPCDGVRKKYPPNELSAGDKHEDTTKRTTSVADVMIPPDYNNYTLPKIDGQPVLVTVGISVAAITQVRENTLDMDFISFLHISWYDCRLVYNFSEESIFVPKEDMGRIWKPDLHFRNIKSWESYKHIEHKGYANFFKDNHLLLANRYLLNSMCNFDFKNYPFDFQECGLDIESFAHTSDEVQLNFSKEVQMDTTMPPIPQFSLISINGKRCNQHVEFGDVIGRYDCLGFLVKFQRRYHYFLWQVYFPSGILVAISWLSFWIDVNAVPGRIALVITTFLTLATQFAATQSALPPVSYLKAVDVWLLGSMIFVFLSLLEYVLAISYENKPWNLRRIYSRLIKSPKVTHTSGISIGAMKEVHEDCVPNFLRSSSTCSPKGGPNLVLRRARRVKTETAPQDRKLRHGVQDNQVDAWARVIFLVLYVIFNISYWWKYLP